MILGNLKMHLVVLDEKKDHVIIKKKNCSLRIA
jgi:hypothetical protein